MKLAARRLVFGLIGSTLAIVAFSSPTAASAGRMPASGEIHDTPGTFVVTSVQTEGANTVVTATAKGVLTGTFAGPFDESVRQVTHRDGSADIRGTATCVCVVAGKSGQVTFGFRAQAQPDGNLTGRFWVDSAAGSLDDLQTRSSFQSSDGANATYSGWFSIDD